MNNSGCVERNANLPSSAGLGILQSLPAGGGGGGYPEYQGPHGDINKTHFNLAHRHCCKYLSE